MKPSRILKFALLTQAVLITACDDGDILPAHNDLSGDDGITVVMTGSIRGADDTLPEGYSAVLAAFKDGDDFAIVSKPVHDGSEAVQLNNISTSASTVELCIINTLRKRILTLASIPVDATDTKRVNFDVGSIDASPFNVINTCIFAKSCTQCHGGAGQAAAGLNLTYEQAYANLVGVPSTVLDGELRVAPEDATRSTLWQAVATTVSQGWHYDHSNLLPSDQSEFIKSWINALTK